MKKYAIVFYVVFIVCLLTSCSSEEVKAFNEIQKNYEQEDMQNVIDAIYLFKENYPDSSYSEEVDEIAEEAEKYIADHFEPIEEKYYESYIGVLDFGAYTGLTVSESSKKEGPYSYINVKDYMLINYVESLKEKGFEDDGFSSHVLDSLGVEINNMMYLKNTQYHINLVYDPEVGILTIGVY